MNADIFAEWLRLQDHYVIRTASSFWFDQGPRTYQAFPYHWLITPTSDELDQLLSKHRAIGLRYSTPLESNEGQISYHAIFDGSEYTLDGLSKWARKNVRRGLRNCDVHPISFDRIAEEGWELQVDTLERQGRDLALEKSAWQRRCYAAAELPGFEAWAAIVDERLAATVITFRMEDCAYMLYQQCHRDFLRDHVNNALSFVVTKTLMERAEIRSILYGLHSLDAPSSVDEFKFRMGYRAQPVRQRVVLNRWLSPFVGGFTHSLLQRLTQTVAENPFFTKSEGMLRFFVDGKKPLIEQSWPEALLEEKSTLLATTHEKPSDYSQ